MRNFLHHTLVRLLPVPSGLEVAQSRYRRARQLFALRLALRRRAKDVVFMSLGILSAAFGLESFLLPNGFLDGGATGIALLTDQLTGLHLPALLVLVNAPFMLVAHRTIGREFALKTTAAILALAALTALMHFPVVTHDRLLVAIFGGFFMGAGVGLAVRGGSVIDGTEVLALALSRRMGVSIGDIILAVNVFIFGAAAWLISVETALYAMLTYLVAGRTVDFVVEGIEEYTGLTIISPRHEEVKHLIGTMLGRGMTVYTGRRGFGRDGRSYDTEIIYCVITRLEVSRILAEIERIDPHAFVVMSPVKDTRGGIIKKRPLQH